MRTGTAPILGIPAVIMPTATFIENRLHLGHPSKLVTLSLHCFCAYSTFCPRGNDAWCVAPGYKLLRNQRALVVEASPPRSERFLLFCLFTFLPFKALLYFY